MELRKDRPVGFGEGLRRKLRERFFASQTAGPFASFSKVLSKEQFQNQLRRALIFYASSRSAVFAAESWLSPAIEFAIRRERPRLPTDDLVAFRTIQASLEKLIQTDVENILDGVYPLEVMIPEGPVAHLRRMPKLLREGIEISKRRSKNSAHEFSERSEAMSPDLPDYYRRNFHFQGDGYLSADSASLYEHQVDILFAGAADAMRRLIIAPMRAQFGYGDGEGLRFLELGAGTGRATRFVRLAYPRAKITALDLSGPYLRESQSKLKQFSKIDFVEGAAESLPFQDAHFDAVYSVFLFHELPNQIRQEVLFESVRVLKPGGFAGVVDSLQLGDRAELDQTLKQFPLQFHEPFYRHYIENPLWDLLAKSGFEDLRIAQGFLSKVVYGKKPT